MSDPHCDYCDKPAEYLKSSRLLYQGRDFGPVWVCWPCRAWVGCHGSSRLPKGRLANRDLRRFRMSAHAAFDQLWKRGTMSRADAYKWLAAALKIRPKDCHIGMFDEPQCREVVSMCRGYMAVMNPAK